MPPTGFLAMMAILTSGVHTLFLAAASCPNPCGEKTTSKDWTRFSRLQTNTRSSTSAPKKLPLFRPDHVYLVCTDSAGRGAGNGVCHDAQRIFPHTVGASMISGQSTAELATCRMITLLLFGFCPPPSRPYIPAFCFSVVHE